MIIRIEIRNFSILLRRMRRSTKFRVSFAPNNANKNDIVQRYHWTIRSRNQLPDLPTDTVKNVLSRKIIVAKCLSQLARVDIDESDSLRYTPVLQIFDRRISTRTIRPFGTMERIARARATQIASRRNRPVIFRIKSRVSRRAISTRFANDARDVGSFLS